MNELPTEKLAAAHLPEPGSAQLAEFAHTFDGYRHFGGLEPAIERMEDARRRWEADSTLPDRIDDIRACLFIEFRR